MGVRFAQQLADHGDGIALLFADGTSLTYRALAGLVAARAAGLGPVRQLILWDARPDCTSIVTYLAALSAGHPVLPLAPGDARNAELIATYRPDPATPFPYHPDLSLLLSTSGSTGAAKAVRLSAANLESNAAAIAQYLNLTPQDRAALILPLHYSYGLSVLHAHLTIGASVDLGVPGILDPQFKARLRASRCTNLSGVPYSFDLLEQIGFRDTDWPDLRFMTVAGGRLAPALVRRYAGYLQRRDAQFFVMYGQTEATARIAYLPPAAALDHADCIGTAIPGGALTLIDTRGQEIMGVHETGELVYRGPNVMMGYAENRDDLARGADLRELRTGDLAERNAAGFYRITGRRSRFSKIAGQRIGHDTLEKIYEARGIQLAVTGDDHGLRVAFAGAHDAVSLRTDIAHSAGLNATFIQLLPVAVLPRRAQGKIDYTAVANLFAGTAPTLPQSVHQAFAETFAPHLVRDTDSFVALGGDSLSFVQLSLALERILAPLPRDWERRSIADLQEATQATPPRRGLAWTGQWRRLDANLFMRALAILLIVLHHATLWEIAGGAATLLVLAGYNVARFHAPKLLAGEGLGFLRAVLRPLILYYAVLLAYCIYAGRYPWQSLALLGNLGIDGYSTMTTPLVAYWFIEAYAQMMLFIAGLSAIPALRRAVQASPFQSGLVFLALCIVAREGQPLLWSAGDMKAFVTPRVLYLAAIGWCIYFADTRAKRLFMTMLIVTLLLALPYFEGAKATILWVRATVLICAALTLLWWASIALPRYLAGALSAVAAASYSIYLFHNVPFFLWLKDAGFSRTPAGDVLHFVLGLALGFAMHHLVTAAARWVRLSSLAHMLWRGSSRRLQPGE